MDIYQDSCYAISTASNILQTLCEKMSCPVGAAAGLIKLKRCSNEKQHEKNYARTSKGQVACEKQDRHNHNRVQRRADRASAKSVRRWTEGAEIMMENHHSLYSLYRNFRRSAAKARELHHCNKNHRRKIQADRQMYM